MTLGLIGTGEAVPLGIGDCMLFERERECIGSILEARRTMPALPLATLILAFLMCFGGTRRIQSIPVAFLIFFETSEITSSSHTCPSCCAYTTRSKMNQQEKASSPKDEQQVNTVIRMQIASG